MIDDVTRDGGVLDLSVEERLFSFKVSSFVGQFKLLLVGVGPLGNCNNDLFFFTVLDKHEAVLGSVNLVMDH